MDTSYAVFCGIDVGKGEHHAAGLTAAGKKIHDKALPNDETKLRAVFDGLAAHEPVLVIVDRLRHDRRPAGHGRPAAAPAHGVTPVATGGVVPVGDRALCGTKGGRPTPAGALYLCTYHRLCQQAARRLTRSTTPASCPGCTDCSPTTPPRTRCGWGNRVRSPPTPSTSRPPPHRACSIRGRGRRRRPGLQPHRHNRVAARPDPARGQSANSSSASLTSPP